MFCNGHECTVTKNLGAALQKLRLPDGARKIWIDALCINQDDVLERNEQVRLMGEIYSRCSRVIVWLGQDQFPKLGPWKVELKRTQEVLRHVYTGCSQYATDAGLDLRSSCHARDGFPDPSLRLAMNEKALFAMLWEKVVGRSTWLIVRSFYRSPWFTRIWCVQ